MCKEPMGEGLRVGDLFLWVSHPGLSSLTQVIGKWETMRGKNMQDVGPWISRPVGQPLLGHSPLMCSQESGYWETRRC